MLETQREPPGSRSRSYRVPCKRDGWRLPGDAEAGAVGGRETGAGRAATGAAGRDGDGSRGLETEHPFTTIKKHLSFLQQLLTQLLAAPSCCLILVLQ